jgi:hypothetical protein
VVLEAVPSGVTHEATMSDLEQVSEGEEGEVLWTAFSPPGRTRHHLKMLHMLEAIVVTEVGAVPW